MAGTILRVRTTVTGVAGTPWYVNLHFGGGTAEAAGDAQRTLAFWHQIQGALSSRLVYTVDPEVAVIDTASGQQVGSVTTPGGSYPGTNPNAMLPTANQLLVQLHTGAFQNGRRIAGRIQVPGWCIDHSTPQGGVDPAIIVSVADNVKTLLIKGTGEGTNSDGLVVYSKKSGLSPFVASATVWDRWAVLRSRRD